MAWLVNALLEVIKDLVYGAFVLITKWFTGTLTLSTGEFDGRVDAGGLGVVAVVGGGVWINNNGFPYYIMTNINPHIEQSQNLITIF